MHNLLFQKLNQGKSIICFDLDGALLIDRDEIHLVDRKILGTEHDVAIFIPTSGRILESIKRTFRRNELSSIRPNNPR